jgi:hypothetical protein
LTKSLLTAKRTHFPLVAHAIGPDGLIDGALQNLDRGLKSLTRRRHASGLWLSGKRQEDDHR